MIRKAMIFPSKTKMMVAFRKFKDDYPEFMFFMLDLKVKTPNTEIFFFCPDDIGNELRGHTFHEVVIVDKVLLTKEELMNLQLCILATGGNMRTLK